jgi:hypothetical protein
MADSQLYSKATVYVDSQLLAEEAEVTVKRTTGSQAVKTVHKGYAGESPGSAMAEITVSSKCPAKGFELDPGKYMKDLKFAEITVFAASAVFTGRFCIHEDSFKHGVDSESSIEFSARGPFVSWERQ